MKLSCLLVLALVVLASCNDNAASSSTANSPDSAVAVASSIDPAKDWKFGIALWTFHTFNFPESLDKIDSAGIKYIEPIAFQSAGPELKDSMILQLSPPGIQKVKAMIEKKGLICESIYLVGDSTILSWKKQFDIAKALGVKFVSTEPPLNMWDSIDSLAGIYGIKVAIHEHWKGPSKYWSPDTVLLAIKGHPNFGACADLGHWPKSGIDPVDAIKKLSGHIICIHLRDIGAFNNPALRDTLVGTGVVNFPAIFAELKKQGFKGHIYIELDANDQPSNLPAVIHTVKYYNDQLSKLQ